jgi:hypothetical protein
MKHIWAVLPAFVQIEAQLNPKGKEKKKPNLLCFNFKTKIVG